MTAPPDIQTADLSTSTSVEGSVLTARLIGTADSAVRAELETYVKNLHQVATAAKFTEVVMDIRTLDFMNSSCFKTFVVWVGTLEDALPADQYRVRFLSDEKKHWQSRSLAALACFAIDLIDVDGRTGSAQAGAAAGPVPT